MFQLAYVSSAVELLTKEQLKALLVGCRENNHRLGVTGMLLYKDGNFMQLLEGEKSILETLFSKISRDPRHRGIIALFKRAREERDFAEWSMGFRNLDDRVLDDLPGYNQFLNTPLTVDALGDRSRVDKLFAAFRT